MDISNPVELAIWYHAYRTGTGPSFEKIKSPEGERILAAFKDIDKNPAYRQVLEWQFQNWAEGSGSHIPYIHWDGTQSTPAQDNANAFIGSGQILTTSILGGIGQLVGQYLYPDDPVKQANLAALFANAEGVVTNLAAMKVAQEKSSRYLSASEKSLYNAEHSNRSPDAKRGSYQSEPLGKRDPLTTETNVSPPINPQSPATGEGNRNDRIDGWLPHTGQDHPSGGNDQITSGPDHQTSNNTSQGQAAADSAGQSPTPPHPDSPGGNFSDREFGPIQVESDGDPLSLQPAAAGPENVQSAAIPDQQVPHTDANPAHDLNQTPWDADFNSAQYGPVQVDAGISALVHHANASPEHPIDDANQTPIDTNFSDGQHGALQVNATGGHPGHPVPHTDANPAHDVNQTPVDANFSAQNGAMHIDANPHHAPSPDHNVPHTDASPEHPAHDANQTPADANFSDEQHGILHVDATGMQSGDVSTSVH